MKTLQIAKAPIRRTASWFDHRTAIPWNGVMGLYWVQVIAVIVASSISVAAQNLSSVTPASAASLPRIASEPLDSSICDGETALFVVKAVGTPPFTYRWFHDNSARTLELSGQTDAFLMVPAVRQSSQGKYFVEVRNSAGSVQSRRAVLQVRDCPVLSEPPGADAIFPVVTEVGQPTGEIPFQVRDRESQPEKILMVAFSSNQTILPNSNLIITGDGASRTLKMIPIGEVEGGAQVTRFMVDGDGRPSTSHTSFNVYFSTNAPRVDTIPDQVALPDVGKNVYFEIKDKINAWKTLGVKASSSNSDLVRTEDLVLEGTNDYWRVGIRPIANRTGVSVISFTVTNSSGASTSSRFQLTVRHGNSAPSISPISGIAASNTPAGIRIPFTVADVETATDDLHFELTSSLTSLLDPEGMRVEGRGASRSLVLQPKRHPTDITRVRLTVRDREGMTGTTEFDVKFDLVNCPEMLVAGPQSMKEDEQNHPPVLVIIADQEIPTDKLVLTVHSSNQSLLANHKIGIKKDVLGRFLTFVPETNMHGNAFISLDVFNGQCHVTTGFWVTVTSVNDAPKVYPENFTVRREQPIEITVLGTDVEGDTMVFSTFQQPSNGSLKLLSGNNPPRWVYTPNPGFVGEDTFWVRATDGPANSLPAAVTVTVLPYNTPPEIEFASFAVAADEDQAIPAIPLALRDDRTALSLIQLLLYSSDPLVLPPANIRLETNASGLAFRVELPRNQFGTVRAGIIATDHEGGVSTNDFELTVKSINDVPVIELLNASTRDPVSGLTGAEDQDLPPVLIRLADIETPVEHLSLELESDNSRMIESSGMRLEGSGAERNLLLRLAKDQFGEANVTLTVKDADGGTNKSRLNVVVAAVNDLPTISLIHPKPKSGFPIPAVVTIEVSAADVEGPLAGVEFFLDGRSLGVLTGPPYKTTATELPTGKYVAAAQAIDQEGGRSVLVQEGFELAVAPANDLFANRQLVLGVNSPFNGSTFVAGMEPNEPQHAPDAAGHSVWWNWLAPADGLLLVTATSTAFEPLLAIYEGSSLSSLVSVGSPSAADPLGRATISARVQAGREYSIALDGKRAGWGTAALHLELNRAPNVALDEPKDGTSTSTGANLNLIATASDLDGEVSSVAFFVEANGQTNLLGLITNRPFAMLERSVPEGERKYYAIATDERGVQGRSRVNLVRVNPPRPKNDDFENRENILGRNLVLSASNVEATRQPGEPAHAGVEAQRSVWWTWTPETSGHATIATVGSTFDTQLAVYTGFNLNGLDPVASDADGGGAGGTSKLSFLAIAGIRYAIAVDGFLGKSGRIQLEIALNEFPSISLTAPTNNSRFVEPTNILMTVQAADPDGQIQRVEYYSGNDLIGTAAAPPFSLTWSNVVAGFYRISARAVDDKGLSQGSGAASVEVAPPELPPVVVEGPNSIEVPQGGIGTFRVKAVGGRPLFYQWFQRIPEGAFPIQRATNDTLILTNVSANLATNYYVVIRNQFGETNSPTATLSLLLPPTIVEQPRDINVVEGRPATFSVTSSGSPPLFFQWRFNDQMLEHATNSTYTITSVSSLDDGFYHVSISNKVAGIGSSKARLTVIPDFRLPETPRPGLWVPSGTVNSMVAANNVLYLGGRFDYVGPVVGHTAVFTPAGGSRPEFPKFNGDVKVIVADGNGGWLVGGFFNRAGEYARTNLARVKADGTVDENWAPNPDRQVLALVVVGSTVYAGGGFTQIGGLPRSYIAGLELASGRVLTWSNKVDGVVRALASNGTSLFFSGEFTSVNEAKRSNLASFELVSHQLEAFKADANGIVDGLAVVGSVIFVSGDFTSIKNEPRSRLAALESTTGDLLPDWGANFRIDRRVRALTATGGRLFVGGDFRATHEGVPVGTNLVALELTTGKPVLGWAAHADRPVWALASNGKTLFVGGSFAAINGEARSRLAALDLNTAALDQTWNPSVNAVVLTLAAVEELIYAGGEFISAGGLPRRNLAAIDLGTGKAAPWDPNLNGEVRALLVDREGLFAAGEFTEVSGQRRNRIAAFNLQDGQLKPEFLASATGPVLALSSANGVLYLGGEFESMNDQPRHRLAAVSVENGTLLPWDPKPDRSVYALASDGSQLFVGGDFETIASRRRIRAAAFRIPTGELTAWQPSLDAPVKAITTWSNIVFVGGHFNAISGPGTARLAAFNAQGDPISNWRAEISDPNDKSVVESLRVGNNVLFAGGEFSSASGVQRLNLVGLDLSTGRALEWGPPTDGSVYALATRGADVYIGGEFNSIATHFQPHLSGFVSPGAPAIIVSPRDMTVPLRGRAVLSVVAAGAPPLHYQWFHENQLLEGAQQSTLTLEPLLQAHTGSYHVLVSNSLGSVPSDTARLVVLQPKVIVKQPEDYRGPPGRDVILKVEVGGDGPLTLQWRRNGANIPGATGATYTMRQAQISDSGQYSVVISDRFLPPLESRQAEVVISIIGLVQFADKFADRQTNAQLSGFVQGVNRGFSKEENEPRHAGKTGGRSSWITWFAQADGIASFDTRGSGIDTLLAVYTGDNLIELNRNQIASDEDQGEYFTSLARFNAVAGTAYHVAVDGFGGAEGNININWSLRPTVEKVPRIRASPLSKSRPLNTSNVTLAVDAIIDGSIPLEFQWFHNGNPVLGATNAMLNISVLSHEKVGPYFVTVRGGSESVSSASAVVEIGEFIEANTEDKMLDAAIDPSGPAALQSRGTARKTFNGASISAGFPGNQILDNFGAKKEIGENNHAGNPGGASRWFKIRPDSDGVLELDTKGSEINTVLAVYKGKSLDGLTLVASNDDVDATNHWSYVAFTAQREVDYLVAVDGFKGVQGRIKLNWLLSKETDPPPPIPPPSTPPILSLAATLDSLGHVRLTVSASTAADVAIEASEDLAAWKTVVSGKAGGQALVWIDTELGNHNKRYFRAKWVQPSP